MPLPADSDACHLGAILGTSPAHSSVLRASLGADAGSSLCYRGSTQEWSGGPCFLPGLDALTHGSQGSVFKGTHVAGVGHLGSSSKTRFNEALSQGEVFVILPIKPS